MRRLIALAGWILFLALSLSVRAAMIITPQPGISGQTTAQGTFFPHDIAVRVTDASGAPVAHTQVDFINTDGVVFFTDGSFTFSGHVLAFTDANGVAVALGLMGFQPGVTSLTVMSVGSQATSISIPLAVTAGGAPAVIKAVSGSNQHARVGTAYRQPWVARALDAAGKPVPNAAILFFASTDPTLPSVTFNGMNAVFVRADGNGIAVSPVPVANLVRGHDEGLAMVIAAGVSAESAFFKFHNQNAPGKGNGGNDEDDD